MVEYGLLASQSGGFINGAINGIVNLWNAIPFWLAVVGISATALLFYWLLKK